MKSHPIEGQLRDALAARAEAFSASPDAWQQIQAKDARLSRQRHSTFMIPAAAAATVVAVALSATALGHGFSGTVGHRAAARPVTGNPARTGRTVEITLSPVARVSADQLAAAARLISERVARSGLPVLPAAASHAGAATVVGPNVVLTGLAADKSALEGLAGMGVLRFRHVLLEEPADGPANGDANLVRPGVLRLFRKLVCTPGESDTAWQQQVGYMAPADWNDPAAQVVSCSSGTKYALDAATVLGQEVTRAVPAPSRPSGQWVVALTVNGAAASAFSALTTHLYKTYFSGTTTGNQNDVVLDQVAVVLDGTVLSAPETDGTIAGGRLEISPPAGLTRAAASALAAELRDGPLPVAFRIAGTAR